MGLWVVMVKNCFEFHNNNKNLFVWVGEEDHLRIVSMQGDRSKPIPEGKQIKEVTARFMRACAEVQKVLKAEGSDFMHNDHLGSRRDAFCVSL